MTDTRVRVPLNGKQIDLAALDAATGGHGLSSSDLEVVAVEGSPVTAEQLAAALSAHKADGVEPAPSIEERVSALEQQLLETRIAFVTSTIAIDD